MLRKLFVAHLSFNAILGRAGRLVSEEVVLHVCLLRTMIKLFRTYDNDIMF